MNYFKVEKQEVANIYMERNPKGENMVKTNATPTIWNNSWSAPWKIGTNPEDKRRKNKAHCSCKHFFFEKTQGLALLFLEKPGEYLQCIYKPKEATEKKNLGGKHWLPKKHHNWVLQTNLLVIHRQQLSQNHPIVLLHLETRK